MVEAELEAFASREIAVLVVDACPGNVGETLLMSGSRAGLGADLAALLERERLVVPRRGVSERLAQAHLAEAALTRLAGAPGAPVGRSSGSPPRRARGARADGPWRPRTAPR